MPDEKCGHCEAKLDEEDLELRKSFGPLTCPECDRDGCGQCMPSGRGLLCPECESG
jgi:hypothetical protein